MPRGIYKDLTGQQFGKLTVVALHPIRKPSGGARWEVECECGTSLVVYAGDLRGGQTSCAWCSRTTHGQSRNSQSPRSPEYSAWCNIKYRSLNPNCPKWKNYGGRTDPGPVTICARWSGRNSFPEFFEDMGPKPSPDMSIDRIDNDGGYWCGHCPECVSLSRPSNCRWATDVEQNNNQRKRKRKLADAA